MKKQFLIAVLLAASSLAFANGDSNTCGNHGNNCDSGSPVTGNGGAGGNAAAGAVALAGASATGGNSNAAGGTVLGSGNSSIKDSGNSAAGAAVVGSGNSKSKSEVNGSGNANVKLKVEGDKVTYEAARIPVATAYASAPPPSAPCMGSSAIGGQGALIGLSVSTTWTSEECNNRENYRFAATYGNQSVAEEMMRGNMPGYAEAEKRLADRKAGKKTTVAASSGTSSAASKGYTGDDPIVRARLNLPPLK